MNSEDPITPPSGVAVTTHAEVSPAHTTASPPTTRHRSRTRSRKRSRGRHRKPHHTAPHSDTQERAVVTDGTQLHQARQNHSTYDRSVHHRSQGGTGYGMKRDHVATDVELSGVNIPPALLPSYAHSLQLMGVPVSEPIPHQVPMETPVTEPTLTDAEQRQWEEQQMRQAHAQDQQTPQEIPKPKTQDT